MLSFAKLNGNKIEITQIVSSMGCKYDQEATLKGLGLKMHKSVTLVCSPSVFGMVKKIQHLLNVKVIA